MMDQFQDSDFQWSSSAVLSTHAEDCSYLQGSWSYDVVMITSCV